MDPSASETLFTHSRVPSPSPPSTETEAPTISSSTSTLQPAEASSSSYQEKTQEHEGSPSPTLPPGGFERKESFKEGLESEVEQVLGSWKSFWGGVQKQVAPTISAVRKDINSAAVQAKAELERLQTEARARNQATGNAASPSSTTSEGTDFARSAMFGNTELGLGGIEAQRDIKGKGKEVPETTLDDVAHQANIALHSLFTKLQSSLPNKTLTESDGTSPTIGSLPTLASFQQSLSHTLSSNPNLNFNQLDLPAFRKNLTTSFQKLQTDLHIADAEKLAEEYLKKSEDLLADAGRYLQDAVKVIPPMEDGGAGVSWDGSDVWTIPESNINAGATYAQSEAQVSKLTGKSISEVRALRKDALLKALKSNKELLTIDPSGGEGADQKTMKAWEQWLKDEVEAKGGIDGDHWTELVWNELGPTNDEGVEELKATRDELVPTVMTKETFWTRYFFRIRQIEQDAERRKYVLDSTTTPSEEENFSWEDEEETATEAPVASTAGEPVKSPVSASPVTTPSKPTSPLPTSVSPAFIESTKEETSSSTATTSPRLSEESYDIVSQPSGNVKAPTSPVLASTADKAEESEDSDWE